MALRLEPVRHSPGYPQPMGSSVRHPCFTTRLMLFC